MTPEEKKVIDIYERMTDEEIFNFVKSTADELGHTEQPAKMAHTRRCSRRRVQATPTLPQRQARPTTTK